MITKRLFLILLAVIAIVRTYACGPSYDPDYDYYNLFMQELIDDPAYFPFLLAYERPYYRTSLKPERVQNENIEQWSHYLGLSYQQAYDLVFNASMKDLKALLETKKTADGMLAFATPAFVKRHNDALQYLVYAKYLEPYMQIAPSDYNNGWGSWEQRKPYTANQLAYDEVIQELTKRWKKSKSKELKLRYGYQLVRFAHYNRQYEESIRFFDDCVESLNYRPAMYYHALSQKAGAERGLGDSEESRWHFFQVFVHSRDLKEQALSSISFDSDVDFNAFLEKAQTPEERNDIYLLLGYRSYNNPLSEVEKIVATSPQAVQAKVLIARSINQVEREMMSIYHWVGSADTLGATDDRRYPLLVNTKVKSFVEQILNLTNRMVVSTAGADQNYWLITSAYLNFLKKNFDAAQQMLDRIQTDHSWYIQQKQNLAMYIDICKQPKITPELEMSWLKKYSQVLDGDKYPVEESDTEWFTVFATRSFVLDVLANRYYLQQDYAKSFLLNNHLAVLENNPQLFLLKAIDTYYHQPDKNEWETFLMSRSMSGIEDVLSYLNYIYGIVYLTQGEIDKASSALSKTTNCSSRMLPSTIFGYNRIECFECPNTMEVDYLSDFQFILEAMTYCDLAEALLQLKKIADAKTGLAAKANYLLGNFFYNVSESGYFRQVLRFGSDNGNDSQRYHLYHHIPNGANEISFKYYSPYYEDPNPIARQYLENAYQQTSDRELKARIVFALSKCEQHSYNFSNENRSSWWYLRGDDILISGRESFKELMHYQGTAFFDVVQSNCKYFDYYVTRSVK